MWLLLQTLCLNLSAMAHETHEWLGAFPYQDGLPPRVHLESHSNYAIGDDFPTDFTGSLGFAGPTHLGLSLLGAEIRLRLPFRFRLGSAIQHERWTDWRITENRYAYTLEWQPVPALTFTLGRALRAPQYMGMTLGHAFAWPEETKEYLLTYRLAYRFLEGLGLEGHFILHNMDRARVYTEDNIHLQLEIRYHHDDTWQTEGILATGIQGLSGAILSFPSLRIGLGVRYAP
jgi:hypothetical protein